MRYDEPRLVCGVLCPSRTSERGGKEDHDCVKLELWVYVCRLFVVSARTIKGSVKTKTQKPEKESLRPVEELMSHSFPTTIIWILPVYTS